MKRMMLYLLVILLVLCSCARKTVDNGHIPPEPSDKTEQVTDYDKPHLNITHRESGEEHELDGEDARYICWLFDSLYYDQNAVCKCDESEISVSTGAEDGSYYYVSFDQKYVRNIDSDGMITGQCDLDDEQFEKVSQILAKYK